MDACCTAGMSGDSPDKLLCQEEERLLIVVVAFCRNLMVLQILLPAVPSICPSGKWPHAHLSVRLYLRACMHTSLSDMVSLLTAEVVCICCSQGQDTDAAILIELHHQGRSSPVERDLFRLDLPVLHVHLVAAQHNWNVFTHPANKQVLHSERAHSHCSAHGSSDQTLIPVCAMRAPAEVSVPGGHVLVGEARGDVKHDDGALPVDVVPIPEAPEFLLACGVPAVEAQLASVGGEVQRVHLHADRGCTQKGTRAECEA